MKLNYTRKLFRSIIILVVFGASFAVEADEIRPGYLEITESADNSYAVMWKVPYKNGLKLKIDPVFPENCTNLTDTVNVKATGALIRRWSIRCDGGLNGQSLSISSTPSVSSMVRL